MPHRKLKDIRKDNLREIDISNAISDVVNGDLTEEDAEFVRIAEAYGKQLYLDGRIKAFTAGALFGREAHFVLEESHDEFEEQKEQEKKDDGSKKS